ncbi:hypothetical protein CNMCM5623_007406 [Aspergillus felis]|uniref:Uncharacterized protein n=1 Tax=Aspergillus felis TaxID=1287682 RepID=A0A8H6USY6_9EURO|nr:hypothetical protein CNMCM5623_007406 [Aspergillus felis]
MHFSPLVTVASALALAPTAVVAKTAAAAFVSVGSVEQCPKGVAQEVNSVGPKVVTTTLTCEKVKISHDMSVSFYDFEIQPINKEADKCCVKVYDNPGCLGFPVLELPVEGPWKDRCIPEYLFDDEVKEISFKLDCDKPPVKEEPYVPKEIAEQVSEWEAEQTPKLEAPKAPVKAELAPKLEAQKVPEQAEHAPKLEAEEGSEEAQEAPEEAPARKAGNPADSLGLGEITKALGFR